MGPQTDPAGDAVGTAWRDHHRYLLDVAYRMLGSVTEAEDVVQEAYARLVRADIADIEDVRGWLVVVVSRLCLDQLRSARVRREAYVGPWLPEPVVPAAGGAPTDPADRITLDDSVRIALLVVLERLTPAERAAFVLHDVFAFSFDDVGEIVGRTPEACRQLASRARRRIKEETGPARFTVDPVELSRVAARFIEAATAGDLDALMDVLDPDVVGWTDSGGVVAGPPLEPLAGRRAVAERFMWFMRQWSVTLRPASVNGEPGVLGYQDGRLVSVIAFEVRDGAISRIHGIANPLKLGAVSG
jgi:RNA polymerase sigma-70 factor, ECF subfamily